MKRCITIDEEIFINQFTQGIHNLQEMNEWFESYDLSNKRDLLENLFCMVLQSQPTYDEIETSALYLKKLRSSSAVILLNRNKPFHKYGYQICNLPEKELLNGFDILILTLAKSDTRRKLEECGKDCRHWWHKDLSNDKYLKTVRDNHQERTGDGSASWAD